MKVAFKEFTGALTWSKLCDKAAVFASKIGKDRLIGISQAADRGLVTVVVWYWADA